MKTALDCKPHLNIGYLSLWDAFATFAYSCISRINDAYTTKIASCSS